MFFLFGISTKVKPAGVISHGFCPACRREAPLHLTHKYITPHIFFIPTFHLNSTYIATCPLCASVMEVNPQKIRAQRHNPNISVEERDMRILQNNCRFGGMV